MVSPIVEQLLSSVACRYAFDCSGDEMAPLGCVDDAQVAEGRRALRVWAAVDACIGPCDIIVAQRSSETTIISPRGGILIAAGASMNIGMLRAGLRGEDLVRPDGPDQAKQPAGSKALLKLAEWIAQIEAPRRIRLDIGSTQQMMWARQGRFGLPVGTTPQTVAAALLASNKTEQPVTLTYELPDVAHPATDHAANAFFGTATAQTDVWAYSADGVPLTQPQDATLEDAAKIAMLHDALIDWSEDAPFKLSILKPQTPLTIIAERGDSFLYRFETVPLVGRNVSTKDILYAQA